MCGWIGYLEFETYFPIKTVLKKVVKISSVAQISLLNLEKSQSEAATVFQHPVTLQDMD